MRVVAFMAGPMRTLSFKAYIICELRALRGHVHALHTSVDPFELLIEGRVTKYCPFQTSELLIGCWVTKSWSLSTSAEKPGFM